MKKRAGIILGITTITIAGLLSGCQGKNSSGDSTDSDARKIVVAVAPGFYPITYATDDGKAAGYDVSVMEAVDELLPEYEFTYEIADKETLNVGVQTGTYQIGINSLFKTEEREKTYLIPENNMGNTAVGIIHRDDVEVNGFQDVYDKGLSINPTSASGSIKNVVNDWNEENPDAQLTIELISTSSTAEELAAVKAGSYDVAIDLIPVFNLFDEETVEGLTVSDPVQVVPTYPIINANETELNEKIDDALKTLKDNGKLSELSSEYFGYDVFNIN